MEAYLIIGWYGHERMRPNLALILDLSIFM